MNLSDIQIRDPFVLTHEAERCYYLFGSTDPDIWDGPGVGFDCYRSTDLVEWNGPIAAFRPPAGFWSSSQFWAPEVHRHGEHWFMFATFRGHDESRGTQVLRADRPEGPYRPWSNGPVTPEGWLCLDGTLFIEDGEPWLVFCHEFVQCHDGEICAQRLAPDLRTTTGLPVVLFTASQAPWAVPLEGAREIGDGPRGWVTDGPFLHRVEDGRLLMLWSSFGTSGYAMGLATSRSGAVTGPWVQAARPLWSEDGGHGMLFHDLSGQMFLALHSPNDSPKERAVLVPVSEDDLRHASV